MHQISTIALLLSLTLHLTSTQHGQATSIKSELKGTNHIGMTVADMDKSLKFYVDMIGCVVQSDSYVQNPAVSEGVGIANTSTRIAFLTIPGSDLNLEIIQYLNPASIKLPKRAMNDYGYTHICFSVKDVQAVTSALHSAGYSSISSLSVVDHISPTTDYGLVIFYDPDGNMVEFLQVIQTTVVTEANEENEENIYTETIGTPGSIVQSNINYLDHVGITVPNMDSALAYYTNTLGCVIETQYIDKNNTAVATLIGLPNANFKVARFHYYNSKLYVDMMEFISPTKTQTVHKGSGLDEMFNHVCLTAINDLDVYDKLQKQGVQLVSQPVFIEAFSLYFMYSYDTTLNLIEFLQPVAPMSIAPEILVLIGGLAYGAIVAFFFWYFGGKSD